MANSADKSPSDFGDDEAIIMNTSSFGPLHHEEQPVNFGMPLLGFSQDLVSSRRADFVNDEILKLRTNFGYLLYTIALALTSLLLLGRSLFQLLLQSSESLRLLLGIEVVEFSIGSLFLLELVYLAYICGSCTTLLKNRWLWLDIFICGGTLASAILASPMLVRLSPLERQP